MLRIENIISLLRGCAESPVGISKEDNLPIYCNGCDLNYEKECIFYDNHKDQCDSSKFWEWCIEEYKEPVKISLEEYGLLTAFKNELLEISNDTKEILIKSNETGKIIATVKMNKYLNFKYANDCKYIIEDILNNYRII